MIVKLFKLFIYKLKKIKAIAYLNEYNDFTIAEHFRNQGASIGEHSRIMIRSFGDDPYLISIGNHCSISSGVQLITHDGGGWLFTDEIASLQRFGKIEIKDNCYIGLNCVILPNVTIGPNSVIGAGSVVTKDVPPNSVACGNPARVVKTIDEYKEKLFKIWNEQKPPGYFSDVKNGESYTPLCIQKIKNRDHALLKKHLTKIMKNSS